MTISAIDRKRTLQMQLNLKDRVVLLVGNSQTARILHQAEACAYRYSGGDDYLYLHELQGAIEDIVSLHRTLKGLNSYDQEEYEFDDFDDDNDQFDASMKRLEIKIEADMSKQDRRSYSHLWTPSDVASAFMEGRGSSSYRIGDQIEVRRVANSYLAKPWWQDDELEWLLANVLVTLETQAFGEEFKKGIEEKNFFKNIAAEKLYRDTEGNVSKMIRTRLLKSIPRALGSAVLKFALSAAMLIAGAGLSESTITSNYGQMLLALTVAYVLYKLWQPRKELASNHSELLVAMFYSASQSVWGGGGQAVGAEAIVKAMDAATMKGASWPSESYLLISLAAKRSFPGWIIVGDAPVIKN